MKTITIEINTKNKVDKNFKKFITLFSNIQIFNYSIIQLFNYLIINKNIFFYNFIL
jgi:hypothetical protein